MKFRTLICAIVGVILLIHPAYSNLDDGEVCINNMQCSSKACVKRDGLDVAICTHKAIENARCTPQTVFGVYDLYAPCERGLSCQQLDTGAYPGLEAADITDEYGWCIDVDITECEICNIATEWRVHSTGYQVRKIGGCPPAACEFSARYRCDAGYYGNPSTSASGCTKCPDDGTGPVDAASITQCYLAPGTYTDDSGTFVLSAECAYTL